MADTTSDAVVDRAAPPTARGERVGVQSIERAFAILTLISKHEGISLAELSKKVNLHTSTTFHLVRTMVELGIVRQAKATKRYHLGPIIFSLAAKSTSEVQLITLASPYLEDLAKAAGESSHLGIRSGYDVIIAAKIAGGGAFQMTERSGGVRPLHCTALGKVLLAHMPDEQLRQFVNETAFEEFTPKTVTDPGRLWEEIMSVRQAGVGYDDSEFNVEVRCVAAPVYDFCGRIAGAVGISGPVWRTNLQRLTQLSAQVQETARKISRELGHKTGP